MHFLRVYALVQKMEARLANIVHHVTGEADEDTMSAWGSINPGSPLGDNSVARRRGSFALGLQGSSFSGGSRFELDGIGEDHPASEKRGLDTLTSQIVAVVPKVLAAAKAADEPAEKSEEREKLAGSESNETVTASADATSADVPGANNEEIVPEEENQVTTEPNEGVPATSVRRRSNQEDQSQGSEVNSLEENEDSISPGDCAVPHRTPRLSDDDAGFFNQPMDAAKTGKGQIDLEESIGSASDWRYIARQRWLWAFGRVCHLIRRRKRKQLEIMTQRATDR